MKIETGSLFTTYSGVKLNIQNGVLYAIIFSRFHSIAATILLFNRIWIDNKIINRIVVIWIHSMSGRQAY